MTESKRNSSAPPLPPGPKGFPQAATGWGEGAARTGQRRGQGSDAVWRATVDQRLTGVEDAIADLRTRVNSVLALIGAAVVGQIALRFFGH